MTNYSFDESARAERYFTSLIFPHLLMSNDYKLLKVLFKEVFNKDFSALPKYDIEVVCELDPLRDGSVTNPSVKKLYREFKRVAVPDLFLRINDNIMVIEAKFFTHPVDDELHNQVKAQKDAIGKVLKHTKYSKCKIKFCLLTTLNVKKPITGIHYLTWNDIIELIKKRLLPISNSDIQYSFDILNSSFQRAKKELNKLGSIFFKRYKFNAIIDNLPKLIKDGAVYVGFTGGEKELQTSTLKDLKERSHYKISTEKWGENWLTIDKLLGRYILLNNINVIN